jgi:hypothetical protein
MRRRQTLNVNLKWGRPSIWKLSAGLAVAVAMTVSTTWPTFAASPSPEVVTPGKNIWTQYNYNFFTNIHLTEGEQDTNTGNGMGWIHITDGHDLTNSTVLKDMADFSNQATELSSKANATLYLGTTYYESGSSSHAVTVYIVVRWIDDQYDIYTAYPLPEDKDTRSGIESHTTVELDTKTIDGQVKTLFPEWFNVGDFKRETVQSSGSSPTVPSTVY